MSAALLLEQLQAAGVQPRRLINDSRKIARGDVFIAYPGASSDGRNYIAAALAAGAAAVLWESQDFAWNPAWPVVNIGVHGLRQLAGELADLVYGQPSAHLDLIGITGTNGKTTCSQWLAEALTSLERRCAVIGTLGNGFPGDLAPSLNTTPDALDLHASLADYRRDGALACAMEVSSIGLDQGRCTGARFKVAVLTNLSRDHLDYHRTMSAYEAAKRPLFQWPGLQAAVINLDDPFGRRLAVDSSAPLRIGYTLDDSPVVVDWLIRASDLQARADGQSFRLSAPQGEADIHTPVLGRYNVANLLAVAGTLLALGQPFAAVVEQLQALTPPAGRLESLGGVGEPLVVVDYAHTPDALDNVLAALRPVAAARGGRLLCVFGCGGDRDPGKRPQMGEVAVSRADQVWLTSDNPRSEDPLQILADIAVGAPGAEQVPDRTLAIQTAIAAATSADVVLLAGKGHEPYQEIAGRRLPFSDLAVARSALAARSVSPSTSAIQEAQS
jgi:UDP-N-acetylmuramyl-tripeptide synthetase